MNFSDSVNLAVLHKISLRNQHGGTPRSRAHHDGDAEHRTSHSHLIQHHQPTIRSSQPPRVMVSPNTSMKPGDRSLPIRCVIETTLDSGVIQEMESYAIIPCSTFFLDLVGVVLGKLGYSTVQSVVATGHIEVKNWKPLPFNAISDNPQATVGQVLGEVFHLAVLRIKLSRLRWETQVQEPHQETPMQPMGVTTMSPVQDQSAPLLTSAPPQQQSVIAAVSSVANRQPVVMSSPPAKAHVSEVSQRLEVSSPELDAATSSRIHQNHQVAIKLQSLVAHKPVNTLVSGDCPLTKMEIDQLMRGEFHAEISPHKHKAFHEWYAKVTTPAAKTSTNRDSTTPHGSTHSANKKLSRTGESGSCGSHGPIKHRKRFRTTFSLEHEIPKLMTWFREDPRPDPMKINRYLQELNNSEVRKHQAPLRYQAVHIWFKNARAKYKKEGLYTPRHKNGFRRGSMIGPIGSIQVSGYSSNVARIQPAPLSHSVLTLQHGRTVSIPVSAPNNVTPSSIPSQQIPTVVPMSMMGSPTLVSMVTSPGVASPAPTVGSLVSGVVNSIMASMSTSDSEKGALAATQGSKLADSVKDEPDMPKRSPVDDVNRDGVEKTVPSSDHNGNTPNDTGTLIAAEVEKRVLEDSPRVIVKTENVSAIPDEVGAEEEESKREEEVERSRKVLEEYLFQYFSNSTYKKAPPATPRSEEVVSPKDVVMNDSVPVQGQVPAGQYSQHNNQTMPPTPASTVATQLGNSVGKPSRATRRRLIINPVSELPKLQTWFNVNPKPSRSEMKKMAEELNASEWRRNQPFELKSVAIWFKNARAKVAKKEHSLDMDTSISSEY
ncbi:DNA binding [Branchiostoma belcheri]|nr:DNA binding [Branchiostoma belcheri]